VVVIGLASENLVRFAVIENDYWRSVGRTGLGAVMGSKNLKAMVAFGDSQVPIARPDELNANIIEDAELLLPSRPEQHAIAVILGALDDKIELNRQINMTLEAMTRTLFKSWFVDFEPFQDQRMQNSPMGPIPEVWEYSAVAQAVDINPPRSLQHGADATYIDMSALPTTLARVQSAARRPYSGSGSRFRNGDVLLARITPMFGERQNGSR